MPNQPRVCIVILNWNGFRDTLSCLESVDRLEYANYELLVVDNGSHDGSAAELRAKRPSLKLLENGANLGFGRGNNVGIREALRLGADYVWLLNNDATVAPGTLSALVAAAEADPGVGAVGSVLLEADEPERVQAWGGGGLDLRTAHSWHYTTPDQPLAYLTAASLLLRRSAIEQVGMFDERFFYTWEDVDLSLRLRSAGFRLAVAEGARVWHKEATSTGKRSWKRTRLFTAGLVSFVRKHSRLPVVTAVAALALKIKFAAGSGHWSSIPPTLHGWVEGWWRRSW